MAQRLVLIRHGLPKGAPKGAFLGRTDLPLSAEGRRQAIALRPLLRQFKPGVCYCSPLLRASQTTDILLDGSGMDVHVDDALREVDFGQWELMTFEQAAKQSARAVKLLANFDPRFKFPGGESLGGFLARIRRVSRRLSADPAETVLVVTHGGVIRSMICSFLGIRPRDYLLFDVAHAACAVIDVYDNKGVLSGLNLRGSEDA